MTGQHADIVLSDAFFKGLDFDYKAAYAGMRQGATETQVHNSRTDLQNYLTLGYVTYNADSHSCTDTLDYCYDDWFSSSLLCLISSHWGGRGSVC